MHLYCRKVLKQYTTTMLLIIDEWLLLKPQKPSKRIFSNWCTIAEG